MSDEPTNEPTSKPEPEKVHVGLTHDEVDTKIRKLKDEISELHAGDKAEREELKAELAELREYKESQEKANEERDKVKESQHTMVLPPNDIPIQQPTPTPRENEVGADGKKRRLSWW